MASSRSKEWRRKSLFEYGTQSLFKYGVFLSFCGKDTRTKFTDHLYRSLNERGIRTFRDNEGIEKGKEIDFKIREAIHDSEGSIIVLSEGYATSRWCLDEVVMILESRRRANHKVLPVFYHVDPDHVSKQSDTFGQAFNDHAQLFGSDIVKGWRAALAEVASLSGMVIKDGYEAEFIQDIVNVVHRKLNPSPQYVPSLLVGVASLVNELELWLQSASNGCDVCIIHGATGVGKTTLAKHVFNRNFGNFDCVAFASDVEETLKQPNGLLDLQRGLLSDMLRRRVYSIKSVDEGLAVIKEVTIHKRVLFVFDDINELNHLRAMLIIEDWVRKGSKVIITTTQECLDPSGTSYKRLKVEPLNGSDSLKLFKWHAFGQADIGSQSTNEHIEKMIKYCGGLPLALEVLASMLFGKDEAMWENVLRKLEAAPGSIIQNIVKTSYDSIDNDDYKTVFLHIGCFFVGRGLGPSLKRLYIQGVGSAKNAIDYLLDRSFLVIDGHGRLRMHQQIKNVAIEIAGQSSLQSNPPRIRKGLFYSPKQEPSWKALVEPKVLYSYVCIIALGLCLNFLFIFLEYLSNVIV